MSRSEQRENTCFIIYKLLVYEEAKVSYELERNLSSFEDELYNGVKNNIEELRRLANKYLNDWSLDRLSKMDQAILLVAIYELKYTETPPKVIINEAINLAKKYSDDNVKGMINASLDKIYKEQING